MERSAGRDLTTGSITKQLILFALPLIGGMLLSLFFNTADTAVLSFFCGDDVVAGAGCNGAMIDLVVGLAYGISTGSNVIVARYIGAKDTDGVRKTIGTSILFSLVAGVVFMIIGFFGARSFQVIMKCDPKVIDYATTYMKIYFLGMPIILLNNFIGSILRAMGDSFHPMLYLAIGGIVNILLNLFFVAVLKWDIEGVAVATVVSQGIALILSIRLLVKNKGIAKIEKKYLHFYKKELLEIIRVGIPCGIQSCCFSLTNVVLQKFLNSFGAYVMSANSYAVHLDVIVCYTGRGMSLASLSFAGQNLGAKNMKRVKQGFIKSMLIILFGCYALAGILYLIKDFYLGIMTQDPKVLWAANVRLLIMLFSYPLCGIMENSTYSLSGLGKSNVSMIIMLIFCVLYRILWCYFIFTLSGELYMLYLVWPISYVLTIIAGVISFIYVYKKCKKKIEIEQNKQLQE